MFGERLAVDALVGLVAVAPGLLPVVSLADPSAHSLFGAPLSVPLAAEQEARVGCGPWWDTACLRDGIDLLNGELGVLTQSWVGVGSAPGLGAAPIFAAHGTDAVQIQPGLFANELAVVSYNLQMLLIALLAPGTAYSARERLDPDHPYAAYDPRDRGTAGFQGQCSFHQPQFCAAVRAYFERVAGRFGTVRGGGSRAFGRRDFAWDDGPAPPPGCPSRREGLSRLSEPRAPLPTERLLKRRGRCPRR